MRRWLALAILLITVFGALVLASEPAAYSPIMPVSETGKITANQYVKRASSTIAVTTDGSLLALVNSDSNSISLVDALSESVISEIPVGDDPRSITIDDDGRYAYVANHGSDNISIVDLISKTVSAQIPVGALPYGILVSPNGRWLYLAERGTGVLRILETRTGHTVSQLHIADRPSALAISADGQTLYITHLLTNRLTLYDTRLPYTTYLPVLGSTAKLGEQGQDTQTASDPVQPSSDLTSIFLWAESNLVQSIVIGPDNKTAYIPHTRSNTGNQNLAFDSTVLPLVSLVDLERQQHLIGQQFDLATLDPPGVGLPFDAALSPDGERLWVVNAASNDITVLDLTTRQLAAHIEVGDNPRGITLAPDGSKAYVNNMLAGSLSIIDTSDYTITNTILTTDIPLSPLLLQGKRLFNSSDDSRMSNAQWIACSSCHLDADQDGRTWSLAFAGPRNTTSLKGMIETYPLRWSGEWDESADSEFAIRRENFGAGLIEGDMHCDLLPVDCVNQPPNQGRSPEMDALAAYLDSLVRDLSPGHRHGEPLSPSEQRGLALFQDPLLGCIQCHPPPLYTDLMKHDVGTLSAGEKIGPAFDTPTLKGLFNSNPYFHDGSAATLLEALTRPSPGGEHDLSTILNHSEFFDLIQYLLALPYD